MDLQQIWNDAIAAVAQTISDETKKIILIGIIQHQVSISKIENGCVIFNCSNEIAFQQFSTEFVISILKEINSSTGQNYGMQIHLSTVSSISSAQSNNLSPQQQFNNAYVQNQNVQSVPPVQPQASAKHEMPKFMRQDRINPEKTFDSYISDPENLLVYTIAQKIAEDPGNETYNPFYIYGGSGLGKTHMLFAIANKLKQIHPDKTFVYTRAEEFIHNYVESMANKGIYDANQVHFQQLFTQHDVFIMDDIQSFIKAEKARDTFFQIIAEFLDKPGHQLILASDVPPGNLKNFSPRLVSRFGSGVCREIYPPSAETRTAITLRKCREFGVELPESVVEYIANNIRSSVREIEGAIKTLIAHVQAFGSITYDEAVKNLSNLVNVKSQITTLEAIKERVAKEFSIKVEDLDSATRKKPIPSARAIAMCLAQDLIPTLSYNDIGRSFSKDHSSVHEATKKMRAKITSGEDKELSAIYQNLTTSLKKE